MASGLASEGQPPEPDATVADLRRANAALRKQLADQRAERDVALAEKAMLASQQADRNDTYSERQVHQAATNDVLSTMAASPADPQPVFDLIVTRARDICGSYGVSVMEFDGVMVRLRAWTGVSDDPGVREAYVAQFPRLPDRKRAEGRAILDRQVVHVRDYQNERELRLSPGNTTVRSNVAVPMRRGTEVIGVVVMGSRDVGGFSDSQVELLKTFAEQAVIAITSAAAHREQREALERQTAMADVLAAINANPGELRPVFETILAKAITLCAAAFGAFSTFDGQRLHTVATRGVPEAFARYRLSNPPAYGPGTGPARLIAGEDYVHDIDAAEGEAYRQGDPSRRAIVELGGARTNLDVALRKDHVLLGTISIYRREVRPFSDNQIALLQGFAAQAVIAIENARLLTELKESLERQTASGEILQVISQSPTDVTPVLNAVAKAAVRFCGAEDVTISLQDGGELTLAAHEGPIGSEEVGRRYPLDGATIRGRAIIDCRTVHVPDAAGPEGAQYPRTQELARRLEFHAVLAAPMLREEGAIGSIALRKSQPTAFTHRQIELLETFAAQAVIAIENVRLFTELRDSLEQQTATAEILRVISQSPTDVTPVLSAVAMAALKFCGARDAQVALRDGDTWFVAAHEGPIEAVPGIRRLNRFTPPGVAMLDGKVVQVADLQSPEGDEFPEARELGASLGFRSALVAPLMRDNVSIGFIALRRPEPGTFTPNQVELLRSFAAQAAIAIENVRLFTELRDSLERLKAAQANLIQAEKMASLGQLTAGIAHEIKNPLNFVNNFAGLSTELLDELKQGVEALLAEPDDDKRAGLQDTMDMLTGNLAKILEHGRRADGIVKSMLSHSRGGAGDWQESDLNSLVEEALNLAYHGARAQDKEFDTALERDFAPSDGPIEVVPQDVTRVLLNLFGNGFYAITKRRREGGEADYMPAFRVSTRDLGEAVEIRVRDNGIGIPPEVRAKVFQPFFTTKPTGEGTGLGLSISYDIVTHQHGGTIEVASEPGSFTEFTVRLPRSRRVTRSGGAQ